MPKTLSNQDRLKEICPKFVAEHDGEDLCCDEGLVDNLADKLDLMFTDEVIGSNLGEIGENVLDQLNVTLTRNISLGVFQNCPACASSQKEYYCQMYCSPRQSEFIEVVEVVKNATRNGDRLVEFSAKFPKEYTDAIYHTCEHVKQIFFEEQTVSELIPAITVNVLGQRFCKDVDCDGSVWLTEQGHEDRRWPRSEVINSVIHDEEPIQDNDLNRLLNLVTNCTENCICLDCIGQSTG